LDVGRPSNCLASAPPHRTVLPSATACAGQAPPLLPRPSLIAHRERGLIVDNGLGNSTWPLADGRRRSQARAEAGRRKTSCLPSKNSLWQLRRRLLPLAWHPLAWFRLVCGISRRHFHQHPSPCDRCGANVLSIMGPLGDTSSCPDDGVVLSR